MAREHLIALAARTPLLPGIQQRAFLDIDSLLRPVYGRHKQGASFGHAKIASRALLRLGLSPQITTLSTARAAPVIAEARLRSGKAGSGRAATWQVKQAISTARGCGAGTIMLRGDSAFGTKKVMATCVEEGVEFSLSVARNKRISTAIGGIDDGAYIPVHYPGAVEDPDTGELISDAEVAETPYTLRLGSGRTLTVRLIVRRVKDARYPDALFPVWRYHPFVTNSELPATEADITHRRHAIVETTFADLIGGPLAHIPSGLFAANCAWLACAVIAHNLLRAAGTLAAGGDAAVARRCHPASRPGQRARPLCRTGPQTHPAPARPLAAANRVENLVAQHHRLSDCATSRRLIPDQSLFTPPPQARPKEPQGKLVQASRPPMRHYIHAQPQPTRTRQRPLEITDPRIQA